MSGTAAELVPVREIDDHVIGTGEPGEVTRVLQAAFDDAIHGRSERYREWLDVVHAVALRTPRGRGRAGGGANYRGDRLAAVRRGRSLHQPLRTPPRRKDIPR